MKVKRYVALDIPEAVQMIRGELGSDAVILNTKEIRTGGFLGMFRTKKVEVFAAVDEAARQSPSRPTPKARPAPRPQPELPQDTEAAASVLATLLPSQSIRNKYTSSPGVSEGTSARKVESVALAAMPEAVPATAAWEAAVRENALREAVPETVLPVQRHDPPPTRPDDSASLMQELRSMKEMMQKLAKQQLLESVPEAVAKLSQRLSEHGVEASIVTQFEEEVLSLLGNAAPLEDKEVYEAATNVLLTWFSSSVGEGLPESTRVVHFVGPTGVGKTTTIAKLAADQSLTRHRTVGLITADTYRIAAVDQLRTYADILNIPLEVVFSPSETARAFKRLEDRDVVFMDTAGRNYRNELFVSEVNSLLAPGEQAETILVLSLTHKYNDMKVVAGQFAKYGVNQLLLTKVDETDTYGAILNLIKQYSFSISYVACGQTVPDDIRSFRPAEWVGKLLGERAYE